MESNLISLENLTQENVSGLSEKTISGLLNRLICELPKEQRMQYAHIISYAFEFRSITPGKKELRENLMKHGFKFFPIPYNKSLIMGIKRKDSGQTA